MTTFCEEKYLANQGKQQRFVLLEYLQHFIKGKLEMLRTYFLLVSARTETCPIIKPFEGVTRYVSPVTPKSVFTLLNRPSSNPIENNSVCVLGDAF